MKKKLEVVAVGIGGLVLYTLTIGTMLFINTLVFSALKGGELCLY